ncbi:MAG: hypothetical protein BGO95_01175 [Micrococcales bacterium 73-13]|nr:MAG: hypothetical protein BGO95_01175 [Micrococcales bacterium 73-13]
MSDTAAAGWYDDGQHPGQERYWDGAAWTDQFRPAAAPEPVVPPPAPAAPIHPPAYPPAYPPAQGAPAGYPVAAPAPRRRVSIWAWLAPLIVVVLAGIGVGVWLLVSALIGALAGPSDAVATFNRAWNANDCDQVLAVVTQNYQDSADGRTCEMIANDHKAGTVYSSQVRSVEVTNGTATIVAREQWTDGSSGSRYDELIEYHLVQRDGKWLIDDSVVQDGDASPVG